MFRRVVSYLIVCVWRRVPEHKVSNVQLPTASPPLFPPLSVWLRGEMRNCKPFFNHTAHLSGGKRKEMRLIFCKITIPCVHCVWGDDDPTREFTKCAIKNLKQNIDFSPSDDSLARRRSMREGKFFCDLSYLWDDVIFTKQFSRKFFFSPQFHLRRLFSIAWISIDANCFLVVTNFSCEISRGCGKCWRENLSLNLAWLFRRP